MRLNYFNAIRGSKMKRRTFLRWVALSSATIPFQYLMGAYSRKRPPNIVFILIDDFGWKDAGFMGSTYYETPNMDRLAKEGMVFTNAYTNAPNCAPTRASLLTGQYTPRHGIYTVKRSWLCFGKYREMAFRE